MREKLRDINLHQLLKVLDDKENGIVKVNKAYKPIVDLYNVNVRQTEDVYQHACNITAWQQLYDQLKPGQFSGQLEECWLDGIQFFKEYTNLALRQSCMVWPKALWLGIPPASELPESYIGSQTISQQTIAMREGGKEFELNTPDNYTIMGLVIDLEMLMNCVGVLCEERQDQLFSILSCSRLY